MGGDGRRYITWERWVQQNCYLSDSAQKALRHPYSHWMGGRKKEWCALEVREQDDEESIHPLYQTAWGNSRISSLWDSGLARAGASFLGLNAKWEACRHWNVLRKAWFFLSSEELGRKELEWMEEESHSLVKGT